MPISVIKLGPKPPPNPWQKGGAQGAPAPTAVVAGPVVYEWVDAAGKVVVDAAGKPVREVADLTDAAPVDPGDVVSWPLVWRWCPASLLT